MNENQPLATVVEVEKEGRHEILSIVFTVLLIFSVHCTIYFGYWPKRLRDGGMVGGEVHDSQVQYLHIKKSPFNLAGCTTDSRP